MNHTDRVYHVARQVRGLSREMAREAIERYLASAADELAEGEWITLPGIGRLQIVARQNGGRLLAQLGGGQRSYRQPGLRLQTRLRLSDDFKAQCRANLTSPGSGRGQPDDPPHYPVSSRNNTGEE